MFKVTSFSLNSHPDSFDHGTCNFSGTLGSCTHLAVSKIQLSHSFSLCTCIYTLYFSCNSIYGNPAEWSPVTMVASSIDHHIQSNGSGTAHSDDASFVYWSVWVPLHAKSTSVIVAAEKRSQRGLAVNFFWKVEWGVHQYLTTHLQKTYDGN